MIQNPLGKKDSFSPEEIAAHLFTKLKECAEINSKNKFSKVVIPVPSSFKDNQRQAVRDAAGKAGFDNVCFVSEPSAAVVAYSFKKVPFIHLHLSCWILQLLIIKNSFLYDRKTRARII